MTPRIRVAAIIRAENRLLLVEHKKNENSYWLLPGGGVQYGETLHDALKRELMEEVSLEIESGRLVFANDSIEPNGKRHIVNLYFEATVIGGEIAVGGDTRVVSAKFVPAEDLSKIELHPDIRSELEAGFRDGFPSGAPYLGARWT